MALRLEPDNWQQILDYGAGKEDGSMCPLEYNSTARHVATVCKTLQHPAEATLYRNLIIFTRPSADLLCSSLSPGSRKSLLIARHTLAIHIGFRPMSPAAGLIELIRTAERLEQFSCPGIGTNARPGLALLPPALFDALVEHRAGSLKKLMGVSLYGGGCEAEQFVQKLAKLINLEELCTGPIWLPTPASEALRQGLGAKPSPLLLTPKEPPSTLFASLRVLQASFVASNHLFQHLLRAELPNIRHLRVAGWQQDALRAFLGVHGGKIRVMDLHGRYAEFWSYRDPGEDIVITHEILDLCPQLETIILHGSATLRDLTSYPSTHASLRSIHLSASSTEGLWRVPEDEINPLSYPFLTHGWTVETTGMIEETDWRRVYPGLREMTVFMPARRELEMGVEVERWRGALEGKGVGLRDWHERRGW